MADSFEVGEVAIFYDPGHPHHLTEVTITGPLKERVCVRPGKLLKIICYQVEVPGFFTTPGTVPAVPEKYLRKKKPPEELASFERIKEISGWFPGKAKTKKPALINHIDNDPNNNDLDNLELLR